MYNDLKITYDLIQPSNLYVLQLRPQGSNTKEQQKKLKCVYTLTRKLVCTPLAFIFIWSTVVVY